MRLIFLGLFLMIVVKSNGQNSGLEFFTEDGEKFTLMINGEQRNAYAATNVKANDLSGDGAKVKILFEKSIPALEKYFMLIPGEKATFGIRKNKKGEYAFKMISSGPLASADEVSSTPVERIAVAQPREESSSTAVTATSTSTTSTTTENADVSISMNMGVNGVTMNGTVKDEGVGMSLNINGVPSTDVRSTTTTTTTTTSSSSSSNSISPEYKNAPATSVSSSCALSQPDYDDLVKVAKTKSFADAKMTVLKQGLKNQCVTTNQVKGLAQLFSFEEDKLEFVKYAYYLTSDQNKFYQVNDIFSFDESIKQLDKFLENKR